MPPTKVSGIELSRYVAWNESDSEQQFFGVSEASAVGELVMSVASSLGLEIVKLPQIEKASVERMVGDVVTGLNLPLPPFDWKKEKNKSERCEFTPEAWEQILRLDWSRRMRDILLSIKGKELGKLQASDVEGFSPTTSADFNRKCYESLLPWRIYLFKKSGQQYWGKGYILTYCST